MKTKPKYSQRIYASDPKPKLLRSKEINGFSMFLKMLNTLRPFNAIHHSSHLTEL